MTEHNNTKPEQGWYTKCIGRLQNAIALINIVKLSRVLHYIWNQLLVSVTLDLSITLHCVLKESFIANNTVCLVIVNAVQSN